MSLALTDAITYFAERINLILQIYGLKPTGKLAEDRIIVSNVCGTLGILNEEGMSYLSFPCYRRTLPEIKPMPGVNQDFANEFIRFFRTCTAATMVADSTGRNMDVGKTYDKVEGLITVIFTKTQQERKHLLRDLARPFWSVDQCTPDANELWKQVAKLSPQHVYTYTGPLPKLSPQFWLLSLCRIDISREVPAMKAFWLYSLRRMIETLPSLAERAAPQVIWDKLCQRLSLKHLFLPSLPPELLPESLNLGGKVDFHSLIEEYSGFLDEDLFIKRLTWC